MPEQIFRSPGFFEREIDLTGVSESIEGVPAGVIGTAKTGPAFVPVTVGTFSNFENKFGTLDPDKFGPYAVNEFLKSMTALTYVRVLGAGKGKITAAGTVPNAGYVIKGTTAGTIAGAVDNRHKGAVQFLVAHHTVNPHGNSHETLGYPIFSDNNSFSQSPEVNLVRGMIFTSTGSRIHLLDHDKNYTVSNALKDGAKINGYTGAGDDGIFKLVISCSDGASFDTTDGAVGVKIYTASLDPNSKYYISRVLNTSHERFHKEKHILYADFPVESEIARVTKSSSSKKTVGILSGSADTSSASGLPSLALRDAFGKFDTRYTFAKSTSFISQPFGKKEYDLFHFESRDDGSAGNTRVKISIADLRRSDDTANPYGTFSVLVRDFKDTDANPKILERYSSCDLNPASPRYVGAIIGDMHPFYNFDASDFEQKVGVKGQYPNRSKYVRIVMNQDVAESKVPETCLPFGFRGLPVLKTNPLLQQGSAALKEADGTILGTEAPLNTGRLAGLLLNTDMEPNASLTGSMMPPVPFTFKATRGAVKRASAGFVGHPGPLESANASVYWGIKTTRLPVSSSANLPGGILDATLNSNASETHNRLISNYAKFLGASSLDTFVSGSGADEFCNNKFTLARVAFGNGVDVTNLALEPNTNVANTITGSLSQHMVEAAYIRNGNLETKHYSLSDGVLSNNRLTFASLVGLDSEKHFNRFSPYMKFTNVLYGGFDGLNEFDEDVVKMNDKASSISAGGKAKSNTAAHTNLHADSHPGTGVDNNIINSYRTAIKAITSPIQSRINLLSIPGIRDPYVTDFAANSVRDYKKAMFVMDVPEHDDDDVRLYDDSTGRPSVRKTIDTFSARNIDNNYAAAYFPDVIMTDETNNQLVTLPASVAAVSALATNDKKKFPWFAPAGFTRGALDNVVNTQTRLNAEDRNLLYDARINPIASFPNGGFVIFGQKTLQRSRSALDRVNVRRMLLEVKRQVSEIAMNIVFEQNNAATRARFVSQVVPKLSLIQAQEGVDKFKVIMDSTNNSNDDVINNRLNGKIIVVPTRAVEFIAIDFIITNAGVTFE